MRLTLVLAVACYGVATAIAPVLPSGRRMSSSAALAPALASLGPMGYEVAPLWTLLCAGTAAHWVAVAIVRRRNFLWEGCLQTLGLIAGASMLWGFSRLTSSGNLVSAPAGYLVAAVAISSLPYPLAQALLTSRAPMLGSRLREEVLARAPLAALLASTAALGSLAYSSLGVAAFAVLLLPLMATQHGFSRFATARQTYAQTVRGLGKLAEAGGYVDEGHHERVAELSVAVARDLGLWGDRVRALELVALLHDVGTLGTSDPSRLPEVAPRDVARAGARVLEETGYLSKHARFLTAHAGDPHDASPVEARILRVVSRYDDLARTEPEPLGTLSRTTAPEDRRVYDALRRVLTP